MIKLLAVIFIPVFLGSQAFHWATFGQGSGSIYLNRIGCSGNEARLVDCPSGSTSGCGHAHDAGVRCQAQTGNL